VPLIATQSLNHTNYANIPFGASLGYFPDPTDPTTVTELWPVQVDMLKLTVTSNIWHFSGYIYVSGRSDEE